MTASPACGDDRSQRPHRPLRAQAMVGVCLVTCLGLTACDPFSENRAELGPADRERFDRGVRIASPCWSCHDPPGDKFKIGPPLGGFFGQRAGFVKGFPYSPAMQESAVEWNEHTLDRFLADPQALIPQNRMLFAPITDARARADLVYFLGLVYR